MSDHQKNMTYLKDYALPDFLIDRVHLHFDIHDGYTLVKSILECRRHHEALTPTAPLVLDGEDMVLQSVAIDGKKLQENAFTVTNKTLTIADVPDQFHLEIAVKIEPEKNTQLMGLYQSRTNLCTQCESHGFRRITYFLDRPDVMSYFTTTITADKSKYPMLLSNGNLVQEQSLSDNRHWVQWEDPSLKPCYLFALVAGEFDLLQDTFKTMSGRPVDLRLYLEKGFLDQGDYAMTALKNAMRWDEATFGREYDLDIYMVVAVSDFNMGAMENKGLNIFNTQYVLAKPTTAADTNYTQIESVIGHEYFHNWTGNRVTCRDWFQLTLKEGLTVFRDQLFTEDMTSYGVARIDVVNVLRDRQFPEDAGPLAHPIRPRSYISMDNFYTATVYNKGAEVIRMIRTFVTKAGFRKGMDLYFDRHDGQAVTTDDFVKAMEDANGIDLSQFRRWYDQAGTPVLMIKSHYDADQKTYALTVKQSCPATPGQQEKLPFHLPLAVGLIGKEGKEIPLQLVGESESLETTKILSVSKTEETFVFSNIDAEPVPSLLRHFSAPVELHYSYTNEALAHLMQFDLDPFCRWEAGKRLCVNIVSDVAKALSQGKQPTVDSVIVDSFRSILEASMEDQALQARLLALPSLKYLLSHIQHIDLDYVYAAKNRVETLLAEKLESLWYTNYMSVQLDRPYVYEVKAVGERALKSQCLYFLTKAQKQTHEETQGALINYFDLAYQQLVNANNMTDELAALIALNDHHVVQRQQALDYFFERYKEEPLVVNKWLSIQACSMLSTTLDAVKQLTYHPAYDGKNPNNVYALLAVFGTNTLRFHDRTGEGYRFLTEQVLKLDQHNPQVAARVVQPLTRWQLIDAERGAYMRAELDRMSQQTDLSPNLYEIVKRSLSDVDALDV